MPSNTTLKSATGAVSPLSGTANLACAAAGSDLYAHFGESLRTSGPSLLVALALFWSLGTPVDFDPAGVTAGIEAMFQPSAVHFAPLALVLALAIMRWPPFVAIFLGALAGGVLAVVSAPERVVDFAGDGLPRGLALLKGVWATLSGGYVSSTGEPARSVAPRRRAASAKARVSKAASRQASRGDQSAPANPGASRGSRL